MEPVDPRDLRLSQPMQGGAPAAAPAAKPGPAATAATTCGPHAAAACGPPAAPACRLSPASAAACVPPPASAAAHWLLAGSPCPRPRSSCGSSGHSARSSSGGGSVSSDAQPMEMQWLGLDEADVETALFSSLGTFPDAYAAATEATAEGHASIATSTCGCMAAAVAGGGRGRWRPLEVGGEVAWVLGSPRSGGLGAAAWPADEAAAWQGHDEGGADTRTAAAVLDVAAAAAGRFRARQQRQCGLLTLMSTAPRALTPAGPFREAWAAAGVLEAAIAAPTPPSGAVAAPVPTE